MSFLTCSRNVCRYFKYLLFCCFVCLRFLHVYKVFLGLNFAFLLDLIEASFVDFI